MACCCDSGGKATKKKQTQNLTQEPGNNGWFNKFKVAFGFGTKADFMAKKDADEQQGQSSCH